MQVGQSGSILWTIPEKATRITPPEETVAIVIDLTDSQGALRIFEVETDKFVDMIGMDDQGNQVLVPWENQWWFRASGQLRIGYISKGNT